MKIAAILGLALTLAGCSDADKAPRKQARGGTPPGANVTVAEPDTNASVPSTYEQFPAEVRSILYRRDLANQKCSGRFRGKVGGACDDRDALDRDLLAKGWCFGGADDPAAQHWILCAQDYPGGDGYVVSATEQPLEGQPPN